MLLKHKAEVNFVNEHGNSPLHYACFWNYPAIAEDLVEWGALVTIENKYGETPLDKGQAALGKKLHERVAELGQDLPAYVKSNLSVIMKYRNHEFGGPFLL